MGIESLWPSAMLWLTAAVVLLPLAIAIAIRVVSRSCVCEAEPAAKALATVLRALGDAVRPSRRR
jgi:hypothetical protein